MLKRRTLLGAGALLAWAHRAIGQPASLEQKRAQMLEDIERLMRLTRDETGRARLSERVHAAIARVERHRFVPPPFADAAYANRPLPIGEGQTISQPFIVALMTELLDLKSTDRVLEIGTGSGYQAAVLAECVSQVFTIEIVPSLGTRAAAVLRELGYANVEVRIGDGYQGWPEKAPFDAIVVTAAPDEVPRPLIDQLKAGGRMVVPVGAQASDQELLLVTKDEAGQAVTRRTIGVRFVPLTRERR
jgi:protein-L-isoaspartate(D-aspartate) O-methyltransferase